MIKGISATLMFVLTGSAYAQSSVTLYGIVDTAVSYYNNALQVNRLRFFWTRIWGKSVSGNGVEHAEEVECH